MTSIFKKILDLTYPFTSMFFGEMMMMMMMMMIIIIFVFFLPSSATLFLALTYHFPLSAGSGFNASIRSTFGERQIEVHYPSIIIHYMLQADDCSPLSCVLWAFGVPLSTSPIRNEIQ